MAENLQTRCQLPKKVWVNRKKSFKCLFLASLRYRETVQFQKIHQKGLITVQYATLLEILKIDEKLLWGTRDNVG